MSQYCQDAQSPCNDKPAIAAAQAQEPKSAALQPVPPFDGWISIAGALAAWKRQDWPRCILILRTILAGQPWRIDAAGLLAGVYLAMDRQTAARRVLADLTLNYPMSPQAWRLAALLEWKLGQRAAAIGLLERALRELPNSTSLHRQLAVFLGAAGKPSEAAAHAVQSHQAATPHISLPSDSLQTDALEDYLAAALVSTRNAVRLIDQPAAAPVELDKGQSDYIDALIAEPRLIDALCEPLDRASQAAGVDRKMLLEIEWKLSRLCEMQPRHADRQLALAKVQWRLGATTAAMLSLQRALRANPKLVEAHRLRAKLQTSLGDIDAAIQTLRELVTRRLTWPDIHFDIAALQQQRGDAPAARSHLQSALRLNPSFAAARQLLERCAAQAA